MNVIFRFFLFHTVFSLYCEVYSEDSDISVIDTLTPELYSLYKEAFITDKKYLARRMYKGDKQFMLHVQKLREVNGLKTHNLKVEQKSVLREPSPTIIYINNPVEANLPNTFLTVEQFKNAMVEQIEKQKKDFTLHKNISPSSKIFIKIKPTAKVNFGNFNDTNVFTPTIQKKIPSTDTTTEYGEKYETVFDNQGDEITDRAYNIISDEKVNAWTEASTTATTEAKILPKHTTSTTKSTTESTSEKLTESTSEITTDTEKLTEAWTETTLKRETETTAEETTTDEFKHYNRIEEETTEHVKSTVRTRLPRPFVFLGSQNY